MCFSHLFFYCVICRLQTRALPVLKAFSDILMYTECIKVLPRTEKREKYKSLKTDFAPVSSLKMRLTKILESC